MKICVIDTETGGIGAEAAQMSDRESTEERRRVLRERAREWLTVWRHNVYEGNLADLLLSIEAEAEEREREADCADICVWCRVGAERRTAAPLPATPWDGMPVFHYAVDDTFICVCAATAIRARGAGR